VVVRGAVAKQLHQRPMRMRLLQPSKLHLRQTLVARHLMQALLRHQKKHQLRMLPQTLEVTLVETPMRRLNARRALPYRRIYNASV